MRKAVIILLLVLGMVPLVFADDCAPGWVYSRDVIGCIQAKCPPGAGRTYTEHCSCWVSEWGGPPKVTCMDNQLATHCLPEGAKCEENPSPWNPVTGECKSGFTLNADKNACVAGLGTQPSGSGQPTTNNQPQTTSPPPASQSPPSAPQTAKQVCTSRPNMNFASGKCSCNEGYLPDLKRQGCVTPNELSSQCGVILDATYDPQTKKCVCEDKTRLPSGFTFHCEKPQDFASQICNNRYPGSVYTANKKCECPEGTQSSTDKKTCVSSSLGNSCTDIRQCPGAGYSCKDGKCACAEGYRSSPDGTQCMTIEEYGNQVCPQRFLGAVYDPEQKRCKCPEGTSKAPDGKSCISKVETTTGVTPGGASSPCESNANCSENTACDLVAKTCKQVECACGEVKDHLCSPYKCCSDSTCASDESCDPDKHDCVKIDCPQGTIQDHKCDEGNCDGDDRKCSDDKKCENNACIPVPCECGEVKGHACTPYECCNDAQCTTVNTACDTNDHKCKPIEVCKHLLNSGDGASKLDLVFVPDKYTTADKAKFASDVQAIYARFIDMEPFKSNKGKINVHRVDKFDEDLSCDYQRAPLDPDGRENWRLLVCDNGKATQLASKCPRDNVMVVVNSAQYGGSGGEVAVSYNGNIAIGVLVHEFGHMLGLNDEYSYGVNSTTQAALANCDQTITCDKWKDKAGTQCIQKCSYENWFRSSNGGDLMMDTTNNIFFGTVSQDHIKSVLGGYR